MCGIGKTMAVAECETVAGPTDATITTEVSFINPSQDADFLPRLPATTSTATVLLWPRPLATSRTSPPTAPRAADFAQVDKCGS